MLLLKKQAVRIRDAIQKNVGRIRVAELAAGRCAIAGLLSTSVVGNATGASLWTQYYVEQPIVWSTVVAIAGLTFARCSEVALEDKKIEIRAGRQAMMFMLLLWSMEAAAFLGA